MKKLLVVASVVSMLAIFTATQSSAQTIYGCIKKSNGALRVVRDFSQCNEKRKLPFPGTRAGPRGRRGTRATPGRQAPGGHRGPRALKGHKADREYPEHLLTFQRCMLMRRVITTMLGVMMTMSPSIVPRSVSTAKSIPLSPFRSVTMPPLTEKESTVITGGNLPCRLQ